MWCPKCVVEMVEQPVAGATLDRCPGCGGVWFDRDELDGHLAKSPAARRVEGWPVSPRAVERSGPDLTCPRCSTASLRTRHLVAVEIERCTSCRGLFLDRGEIDRLAAAVAEVDAVMTPAKPPPDGVAAGGVGDLGLGVLEVVLDVLGWLD